MADRERDPNPLRNPFTGGRLSIEVPGQGTTPQELERDARANLSVQLADYSYLSAGPLGQRLEGIRFTDTAVVARFGYGRIRSHLGFWIYEMRVAGGTTPVALTTPAVETALVTGAAGVTRTFQLGPIAELVTAAGDAAAGGNGWYIAAASLFEPSRPIWVPPNQIIELAGVVANTGLDVLLVVQAPTIAP